MANARYWLMKSEPTSFSIQDLRDAPKKTTSWDGVRNYQARNLMRAMQRGDQVLFYHSNADPPSIVGIAEVVRIFHALGTRPTPGTRPPRLGQGDLMVDVHIARLTPELMVEHREPTARQYRAA